MNSLVETSNTVKLDKKASKSLSSLPSVATYFTFKSNHFDDELMDTKRQRAQSTIVPNSYSIEHTTSDVIPIRKSVSGPDVTDTTNNIFAKDSQSIDNDFRSMLTFKVSPSEELLAFYDYLKNKIFAEESLEFWFALRNHNLIYRRYKQLQDQIHVENSKHDVDDSNFSPKCVPVSSISISKSHLQHSAQSILNTFILPSSKKEINIPQSISKVVQHRICSEMRYDPLVFKEVRDAIYLLLRQDAYPRFLKHKTSVI